MNQLLQSKPHKSSAAHFNTEHLTADLGRRAIKGGAVTLSSQAVKLFLVIGSTMLLARLLTPEDYGLFGIVSAITALGLVIRDMGLAAATLNSAKLSNEQVSTLLWATVLLNLLLWLLTCAIAPVVGQFYNDPRLPPLVVAMSLTFVILALGSQHQALLRRQMRFSALAVIEVCSVSLGIATAIIFSLGGAKTWSLVAMQIAMAISITAGSWFACSWRPGMPKRGAGTRSLLQFGKRIVAFQVMDYFVRNIDSLLIGRWCGTQILGLYDRAFQLHMIPAQNICWPIGAVIDGTLSRVRGESERFNRCAALTIFSTSAICMPIIAFLFVTAHSAILLLLGSKWTGSVALFRALAPAAFFESIFSSLGWIFIGSNQASRLLRCNLVGALLSIAGFFIGVRWGAVGVAIALSISRMVVPLPTIFFCSRQTSILGCELVKAPIPPIIASLTAAAVIYCFGAATHESAIRFIADCIVFAMVYLVVLMCFPSGREVCVMSYAAVKMHLS